MIILLIWNQDAPPKTNRREDYAPKTKCVFFYATII